MNPVKVAIVGNEGGGISKLKFAEGFVEGFNRNCWIELCQRREYSSLEKDIREIGSLRTFTLWLDVLPVLCRIAKRLEPSQRCLFDDGFAEWSHAIIPRFPVAGSS